MRSTSLSNKFWRKAFRSLVEKRAKTGKPLSKFLIVGGGRGGGATILVKQCEIISE